MTNALTGQHTEDFGNQPYRPYGDALSSMSPQTWQSALVEGSDGNLSGRFKMLSNVLSLLLPLQPRITIFTYTAKLQPNQPL